MGVSGMENVLETCKLSGILVQYVDNNKLYIIREDDILLEVNGVNVEKIKHQDVVDKIR